MPTQIEEQTTHPVVSQDEWMAASVELLAKEKEFTKLRDQLSAKRRELPWVQVTQEYEFETPEGKKSLRDLFGDKSQLIVYHFMFAPGWDEGCPGCSFVSDHFDGALLHMKAKDVAFVAISRAPLAEFLPFKKRMGWGFDWISSAGSTFSYDFGASFRREDLDAGPVVYNFKEQSMKSEDQPGLTVFVKDAEGRIFRTYSTYERGLDLLCGAYNLLDLTPKGRDESSAMDWVDFHDKYAG
ncbi:MAG TPA: thioredoxin family protein [Fimbriimonadaceae bacterium]|nr:thioredoxin family protein [Fimbriimonadaceae bacterium]